MTYVLDDEVASVVQENGGSSKVDNSAAFLNQNFGEKPLALYEFRDGDEKTLGFAGVYEHPDGSTETREIFPGVETIRVDAKGVFAFNPQNLDQYDIKVE